MPKQTPAYLIYKLKDIIIPQEIIDTFILDDNSICLMQENVKKTLDVMSSEESAFIVKICSKEDVYELQQIIPYFEEYGWSIYIEIIDPGNALKKIIFRREKCD